MKGKICLALLALLLVWLAPLGPAQAADPEVKRVDKDTLKGMLADPGLLIIDVRQPSDWDSSDRKITGAQRFLPDVVNAWGPKLPKDKKIVLYCA
jgi:rhodanese-related sulfurtransferase